MLTKDQIKLIDKTFASDSTIIYKTVQNKKTGEIKEFTGRAAPYIIERLNDVFNYGWSFEIADVKEYGKWGVVARIKITVKAEDGSYIVKEHAGGCEWIVDKYGEKESINVGNTVQGAITVALCKAASLFGIGLDAYKGLLQATDKAREAYGQSGIPQEAYKDQFWKKAGSNVVNADELNQYLNIALDTGILDPSTYARLPKSKNGIIDTARFKDIDWQYVTDIMSKYDTVMAEYAKKASE